MILEIATIQIKKDTSAAFEQKLSEAQHVVSQAKGYLSHEFQKCIEHENRYVLLIRWETLEAHTIDFRGSALFVTWRGLIGSFFDGAPIVEHFNLLS
jgi:heme-degrading monooxygenase HmoA